MKLARLTALTAALTAVVASAADPFARGFDSMPTKLSPTMDSLWAVEGAELQQVRSFQLSAMLDMGIGILGLKLGPDKVGDLIPFRADLHLMGAYTIHERIELSADIPFTLLQVSQFSLLRDAGFADQGNPNRAGLDDWRFIGRFAIVRQADFPVAATVIAELRAPFGSGYSFLGGKGMVFAPRAAVERRFGPLRLVANIGWRLRTEAAQYLNLYVGQEFVMGGGASFELPTSGRFQDNLVLAELDFATPAEAPFTFKYADALKTPFEILFGARSRIFDHLGVQLAFGRGLGLVTGYGRETFRIMLGVQYVQIAIPDRDGDGIADGVDKCPDVPGVIEEEGCPEQIHDRDGDGVPDKIDACPDTPGPKEYDGCPDKDGDQIPDNVDKCPDDPGPAETEGCPVPQEEEVTLESDRIRVKGNILYETGKAIIQPQSYKILDDVAKVLATHPDVGPVLIEGHTDNVGGHDYNLDLSNRRAKAVEDYLVNKKIDRKRLRSQGFSYDRPIATNDTPLGRAKNRRTDFRLVDEDTGEKIKPAPETPAVQKK